MSLKCNLRHLAKNELHLKGELAAEELDLEGIDECVHLTLPVHYDIVVQRSGDGVLAMGRLEAILDCECVHCLDPFQKTLTWESWTCFLPLEGEDKVPIIDDCVDLTPFVREDILLDYPQHPLCDPGCNRLPKAPVRGENRTLGAESIEPVSSIWAELNKLKLK